MNYRGVDFMVVQSLSPKGWKWFVNLGHREASGTQYDRERAISKAKKCIDDLIRKREHGPRDATPTP
jgi:hypothetical protein